MKKCKEVLANILAVPVTAVTLVCLSLWALVRTPFDWLNYRRSYFYRELGQRFSPFLCGRLEYQLYNIIRERELPIRFLPRDAQKPADGGWFLYKSTLLVHDLQVMTYNEAENRWLVGNTRPLMEHILAQVEAVNQRPGHPACTQMLLLLERTQVAKKYRDRAEQDFRFLLYDKGQLGQILDAYVRTHPNG